jgi:hypothetical protein
MNQVRPPKGCHESLSAVAGSCGLLSLVIAAGYAVVGSFAVGWYGTDGLVAAAVAAAVCWVSGVLALLLTACFRGPQQALYGMLVGMLFCMGLPLAIGVPVVQSGSFLVKAGVLVDMMVFYVLTLTVKTWASVRSIRREQQALKA